MASTNHNGVLGLLLLLIVTMFGASSSADTYTVGDDLGWTNPPLGNVAYSTWAKTKSFDIGDVLVFQWNGNQNVAEVSKADYDSCNTTNPINGTIYQTSPVSITLTSNQTRYFICTIDDHCSTFGQKVTISMDDRFWEDWSSANLSSHFHFLASFFALFLSIFVTIFYGYF